MPDKQLQFTIEPKDFPVFLKARMMELSVAEFAKSLGVTGSLVYQLLSGELHPSAKILDRLGLKLAYGDSTVPVHSLARAIIFPESFPAFLQGRKGNDTVAEFALKLGVSKKLIYYLLVGTRMPSEKMLRKLNLSLVYTTATKN